MIPLDLVRSIVVWEIAIVVRVMEARLGPHLRTAHPRLVGC